MLSKKLKDLRVEKRLTTKQVSQLIGISKAVYNDLKNNNDHNTGYTCY